MFSAKDFVNRGFFDIKERGYLCALEMRHSSDLSDIFSGEFSATMFFAAKMCAHLPKHLVRVLNVLFARDVLKVVYTVVALVAVFMVDLFANRLRAEECFCNNNVDEYAQTFASVWNSAKGHTLVACGCVESEKFTSQDSTDAPKATDLVGWIACDSSPLFHPSNFIIQEVC